MSFNLALSSYYAVYAVGRGELMAVGEMVRELSPRLLWQPLWSSHPTPSGWHNPLVHIKSMVFRNTSKVLFPDHFRCGAVYPAL